MKGPVPPPLLGVPPIAIAALLTISIASANMVDFLPRLARVR